jgi:hypothetical protein
MTHTYWEYTKVPAEDLAHGYRWIDNNWREEALLKDGSWGSMGGLNDYSRRFRKIYEPSSSGMASKGWERLGAIEKKFNP